MAPPCTCGHEQPSARSFRRGKGSRLVGGTRLVVFPRPNRPQFEKATSRDPLSSRDPLPLAPSQRGAEGGEGSRPEGGGPGSKGGRGPRSWYSSADTVSSSVAIPRAGSPQRAGTSRIFPIIQGYERIVEKCPDFGRKFDEKELELVERHRVANGGETAPETSYRFSEVVREC